MQIIADGYDPTIGFLHTYGVDRPALVFDLMEPQRPIVDRKVLEFVQAQTFHPADFTMRSDGVCRLNPENGKANCSIGNFNRNEISKYSHLRALKPQACVRDRGFLRCRIISYLILEAMASEFFDGGGRYLRLAGSRRRVLASTLSPACSASNRSSFAFLTNTPRIVFSPMTYTACPPGTNTRATSLIASRMSTM
jgi:hypothetical protein